MAFLLVPIEEIRIGTLAPIFIPISMGMAVEKDTRPASENDCRIPTEAELDWMIAATRTPTRRPSIGFSNFRNRLWKADTWSSVDTASDMVIRPNIKVAKPRRMVPVSFDLLFFPLRRKMTPIKASTGVNEDGLRSLRKKLPPEIPVRLRIHAVMVVPTFAPIIRLSDCCSVIRPEFTKPTTMTVVAEELWITAVTTRPVRKPMNLLSVSFPRIYLRLFPALLSRACPMMFIPNRKRLSPPISVNTSNRSILYTDSFHFKSYYR